MLITTFEQGSVTEFILSTASCLHCHRLVLALCGSLYNPFATEHGMLLEILGHENARQPFAVPEGGEHAC